MAQKVTNTSRDNAAKKKAVLPTYLGINKDSHIRLTQGDKEVLYAGIVYTLHPKRDADGKQTNVRKRQHTTSAFCADPDTDESFIAIGRDGAARYRIIGKRVRGQSPQSKAEAKRQLAEPVKKKSASPRWSMKSFDDVCAAIATQQAAGLDPFVRMWFIVRYLDESRANLYRKIGHTFPKPVKRGRGSFWPMSAIEAYKSGRFAGGAK